MGLSAAALFCAVMTELCPGGKVKNIVKLLCGMVMAVAFISPLVGAQLPTYSMNMAKYREEGARIARRGKEDTDRMSRTIIEEECRAYILDKGAALGIALSDARVKLDWSDEGYWYPSECEIEGSYDPRLARSIASELGIGEEEQKWSGHEGA